MDCNSVTLVAFFKLPIVYSTNVFLQSYFHEQTLGIQSYDGLIPLECWWNGGEILLF